MSDSPKLERSLSQPSPPPHEAFTQQCESMDQLEPYGEAIHDQEQNADENEETYQTLSSGVCQSQEVQESESSGSVEASPSEHQQTEKIVIEQKSGLDQPAKQEPTMIESQARDQEFNEGDQPMEEQASNQSEIVQTVAYTDQKNYIEQNKSENQKASISEDKEEKLIQYPSLSLESQRQQQQTQNYIPNSNLEESISVHESQQKQQIYLQSPLKQQIYHQISQKQQIYHQNPSQQQIHNESPQKQQIHFIVDLPTLSEEQQKYEQIPHIQQKIEQKPLQQKQEQRFYMPKAVHPPPPPLSYPSIEVNLQKFNNYENHKGVQINIIGYEQEYFLKIETQIFKIEVNRKDKKYAIRRRYSDFATLDRLVRHHYPGSILYPFPEKSIQMYRKVKLSMGSEQEKITIIEKRLLQLERYLRFLLSHRQISISIILEIFLEQLIQVFQKETNNLLAISIERQKELQLGIIEENYNSIKKMMKSGFNFFNTYLYSSSNNSDMEGQLHDLQINSKKNQELYLDIVTQLQQCKQKLSNFSSNIERLTAIHKQNSQISNIESNIDSVLKLSSKMSSSRAYSEKHAEWIEDNLMYHIRYYQLLLRLIGESVQYRQQLASKMDILTVSSLETAQKIEEKIQLFDGRFLLDWTQVKQELQQNLAILYQKFNAQWRDHCKLMSKIWK